MGEKKVDYKALEERRALQVKAELQGRLERKRIGASDSLQNKVLGLVVAGDYETAERSLYAYVAAQADYPRFVGRTDRYIKHCEEVLHAIKMKRNFPGAHTLPMSKQQELSDMVMKHFDELRLYLVKIEQIEKEVRIMDMKSTAIVIRTFCYVVGGIVGLLFVMELFGTIFRSMDIVYSDYINQLVDFIFDSLGL